MSNSLRFDVLMRVVLVGFIYLLLVVFFAWSHSLKAESLDLDISQVDKAVVRILLHTPTGDTKTGSGVIISQDGYILTNHHVVQYGNEPAELGRKIIVLQKGIDESKDFIEGELKAIELHSDLAVIKINKTGLPSIKVSFASPLKGDNIFALGYPGVADDLAGSVENLANFIEATLTQGVISREMTASNSKRGEERGWYQHSAAIHPGNSGGPLLNHCGQLLGINTFVHPDHVAGMYFASTLTHVTKFLSSENIPFTQDDEPCSHGTVAQRFSTLPAWLIGLLSLLTVLVMAAIFLAIKKPKVIREKLIETYSQWIRRTKPNQVNSDILVVNQGANNAQWRLINAKDSKTLYSFDDLRDNASWIIGRDTKLADIKLHDSSVSKAHLTLSYKQKHFYIEDMSSTNGTKIDGQKIRPFNRVEVHGNARILVGAHELILKKGF